MTVLDSGHLRDILSNWPQKDIKVCFLHSSDTVYLFALSSSSLIAVKCFSFNIYCC